MNGGKKKLERFYFPKSKRASHVGAMVAFLIFIVFLSFIYVILEPIITSQKENEAVLNKLEISLLEKLQKELVIVRVKIDENFNSSSNCLKLSNLNLENVNSFVKDSGGNNLKALKEENWINFEWNNEHYLKIFYANESFFEDYLLENSSLCDSLNSEDYEIKAITKTDYLFESVLNKDLSQIDIELLEELDVNGVLIKFENSEGDLIGDDVQNISGNVYVIESQIRYVDEEANIKIGKLYLGVW